MSEKLKENWKPIFFIVAVLVLTAVSAYPQRKFAGRVVDVIDGRTCVIDVGNGRVTAVLQYIEVPEPQQPMYENVKSHLQRLVLDKQVSFNPRIVMKDRTVGQLLVKNVDISQQMLRDGAAWYAILEKSGQDEAESLVYQDNEAQAKSEKRGVWGTKDLIPSWEYRAEQAALARQREKEAIERMKLVGDGRNRSQSRRQMAPEVQMWANVGGSDKYFKQYGGGLLSYSDSASRINLIFTPSVYLDFPNGNFLGKVESRFFYAYTEDPQYIEKNLYAIGFMSSSKEFKLTKSNNLTLIIDGEKFSLGRARRAFDQGLSSVQELVMYRIKRAELLKMVKARKIIVQIGSYRGEYGKDSLMYLDNLLKVS